MSRLFGVVQALDVLEGGVRRHADGLVEQEDAVDLAPGGPAVLRLLGQVEGCLRSSAMAASINLEIFRPDSVESS